MQISGDASYWFDLIGRMAVATLAGAALGWERSRENRQIMGLRMLSLVGLASCIAVQAIVHTGLPQVNADAAGRVMQGVLSGVGFIGPARYCVAEKARKCAGSQQQPASGCRRLWALLPHSPFGR